MAHDLSRSGLPAGFSIVSAQSGAPDMENSSMTIRITTQDDYERLPGLYHSWDFAMLLEEGRSYLIEEGGRSEDGQALFLVFQRPRNCGEGRG